MQQVKSFPDICTNAHVQDKQLVQWLAVRCRLTGLQKAMVVDMLRRRADTLKQAGLLARLQPHLHGLVTSLDVGLQSSSLQLLAALLPDAPEVQIGQHVSCTCSACATHILPPISTQLCV